jgi:hypothetical protein
VLSPLCAGLLGRHDSFTSDEIIQGDVLSAMLSLMRSVKHKSQLAGLHVIAGLALTSEASARKLLTPNVLQVCHNHSLFLGEGKSEEREQERRCSDMTPLEDTHKDFGPSDANVW